MVMHRLTRWLVLASLLFVPSATYAQATLTGVVRDTTGAVLPGVSVEASSPALIEKVRIAVTDGTGQYRIIDLRPGTYSVTFTLTGFNTARREGILLSGTAVATVDAEMRIGAVEETVTVSGEAAVVDVQSTRQEQVLNREVLAAIPTGRNHYHIAVLIPGMNTGIQDVGGSAGVQVTGSGSIHGATSGRLLNDGLSVGHNGESLNMWVSNVGGAQETVVQTSGGLGEAETGGVVINIVPREGGNSFSGSLFYADANNAMQGSNFTDDLRAKGLNAPNEIDRVYDFNPTFGGRLVRDKLWFFATHRSVGAYNRVAGMFHNRNAGDVTKWTYEPDPSRQAVSMNRYITGSLRLTWQATQRNKFNAYWDDQWRCVDCYEFGGGIGLGGVILAPEATGRSDAKPTRVYQATWQSPVTNRLLLEAGYGAYMQRWGTRPRNDGTYNPALVPVLEQAGRIPGLLYRAATGFGHHWTGIQTWRGAVSYVTGAHNAKFGYFGGHQGPIQNEYGLPHGFQEFRVANGVPNQLTMRVDRSFQGIVKPFALFAQDQWSLGRLTLQGGIRYDYMRSDYAGGDQVDVPTIRAGAFTPVPIEFRGDDLKGFRFHDITPRMGAAYDLFGNGKTALKVTLGKYMETVGAVAGLFAAAVNPLQRAALTTNRAWNDVNRDFVPNCDLLNPSANGECGPMSNRNFGTGRFQSTPDREWTEGWGNRMYNWEFGANVQHELFPRVSVNVGYFRRWFGNFFVNDNRAVGPADFDTFRLTVPTDPRLPDGGGYAVQSFDIKPDKFGLVDNLTTLSKHFGNQTRRWQGVDVTVNIRAMEGLTFQGGFSSGSESRDECEIRAALPESTPSWAPAGFTWASFPFCQWSTPHLTQAKALVAYTIPRIDVQVSTTIQSIPGVLPIQQTQANPTGIGANWIVPNPVVAPALGRPLAGGTPITIINIVEPGALYGERTNQVDFRIARIFRFARTRAQVGLDIYNLTNDNAIQNYNQTFGPAWQTPLGILTARFAKVSVQFDF